MNNLLAGMLLRAKDNRYIAVLENGKDIYVHIGDIVMFLRYDSDPEWRPLELAWVLYGDSVASIVLNDFERI